MKEDLLGLNHWLSFPATCHTVSPRSSALSSGHLRIAPPKPSSVSPKCFRYHAASAALSPLLLKKMPPTPVTFAIVALLMLFGTLGSRDEPIEQRYLGASLTAGTPMRVATPAICRLSPTVIAVFYRAYPQFSQSRRRRRFNEVARHPGGGCGLMSRARVIASGQPNDREQQQDGDPTVARQRIAHGDRLLPP